MRPACTPEAGRGPSILRYIARLLMQFRRGAFLRYLFCPALSRTLLVTLGLALLAGCATLEGEAPGPSRGSIQVEEVLSRIQQQEERVFTFYTLGSLIVRDWYGEADSDVLVVGMRDPLRVKIEITHTWGQPILHILVDGKRLEVLSFSERRLYVGDFTPEALSKFFPGALSAQFVWSALRGYPALVVHEKAFSPERNRIVLQGPGEKEVEVIDLDTGGTHPARVLLPDQEVQLTFSDIHQVDGISYAREVGVDYKAGSRRLTLKGEKVVFNRPVPPAVFNLEKPPGFSVHSFPDNP